MKNHFEEISVCPYCNAPTEERSIRDEGFTFCSEGCGCLEGVDRAYKFICPYCEEIKDEEKCDCKNRNTVYPQLNGDIAQDSIDMEINREMNEGNMYEI